MSFVGVSINADLDPEMASIVEIDLLRQLNGLQLDESAVGTLVEIRNPLLPGGRATARIESVSQNGTLIDSRTRLEITMPSPKLLSGSSHSRSGTSVAGERIVAEVRREIGHYVSIVTLSSPDDLPAVNRSKSRLGGLFGIPKDEVIADVVGRLRGVEWLSEWSKRHYGNVMTGATLVQRSAPFILLAGDPGTGKSALVHHISPVIARSLENQVLFIQLNARLRGTGIQGRAGTEVVNVFDVISGISEKYSISTIVFLDEAEAVAGTRAAGDDSSGAQENVAVVDALIVALDGIFVRSDINLVFISATNLLSRIDAAVARRATIYRFERPSSDQRRLILKNMLGDLVDSSTLDAVNSALERDGYTLTAADVLNQVVGRAIRDAANEDRRIDSKQLLTLAHEAIATLPI